MAHRFLLLAALTSACPALALQTIEARDGVSAEASIALKEATRIKVEGAHISDVFGNIYSSNCGGTGMPAGQPTPAINPGGEIFLECNRDKGEIFVKPVSPGVKPINLFISTPTATYTLLLQRVDMPADTIVIKDRAARNEAGPERPAPNHVRVLTRMLTAMAGDRVPPDVRVEEVNREVALWAEARFTLLRRFEGRGLIGEKYLLTNVSSRPMVLAEQEFDRGRGEVLGVSIESHNLRPGEATQVFIVEAEVGR